MMTLVKERDILPMRPGYSIGNIIKKSDFLVLQWQRRCSELEEELNKARQEYHALKNSVFYSQATKEEKQVMENTKQVRVERAGQDYIEVCGQIDAIYAKSSLMTIEEMLPIDYNLTKIRREHHSFNSEKMSHLIFRRKDSAQSVSEQVQKFVAQFFLQDSEVLDGVVHNIQNMLETESQVCLVGSFITLSRMRTLNPIVLRKNVPLSDNLIKNAADYYVLTGAILGGFFLGVGKHIFGTGEEEQEKGEMTKSLMSRLAMVSFISQGAIPIPGKDVEDTNLWNIYREWKKVLKEDKNSGYPIGFKYNELQTILKENNYFN